MRLARRVIVVHALMLWLGGFLFYSLVVIPTGLAVLEPRLQQTFITQRVTEVTHLLGGGSLLILVWDQIAHVHWSKARWLLWLGLSGSLLTLVALHAPMDELMSPETKEILDREKLRPYHVAYIIVGGLQWLLGVGYLVLMLRDWKESDRNQL